MLPLIRPVPVSCGALLIAALVPFAAHAQPLGTFRWQLQPFCNVVTLAVTQNGGVYRLEGTDDQCGSGADQASAIGTAFPNPDGTIGLGLNIVAAPGGAPVHVDAAITLAALSGTWRDSAGNSGTFALTRGAGNGGGPRPVSTLVVPAAIQLRPNGGVVAGGARSVGEAPASGPGVRMMWSPGKPPCEPARSPATRGTMRLSASIARRSA
jgi:hypothetical protein